MASLPPPAQDHARVVVYRPGDGRTLGAVEVALDDTPVGSVVDNTFIVLDLPAGTHKLYADGGDLFASKKCATDVEIAQGRQYYFILSQRTKVNGAQMMGALVGGAVGALAVGALTSAANECAYGFDILLVEPVLANVFLPDMRLSPLPPPAP